MATYNLSDLRQIATIFSESATYNKGDYCVYQGLFYRCTTAITTAESWTEEHWTQVTVADELAKKVETASTITDTASGAIASFPDGAAEPVIDLTCQIEPVQDLNGISGHEGMTIKRTGKNLIPYPYYRPDTRTHNGITYTVNADGSVTANGTATATSLYEFRHRNDTGNSALTLIPGTYTIGGCPSGGSASTYQITVNRTQNGASTLVARDFGEGATFTLAEDTTLGVYIQIPTGTTVNNLTFYPQVEVGASKTAYEQYQGDAYNVSWQTEAGEVYGGTLDVTTGLLTVDTWLFEDNGGSGWGVIENGYRKSALPYRGVSYSAKERGNWLKPAESNFLQEPGTFAVGSYMNINVSNIAEITDVASLQAYLAEHPLQICYELRDKITYQLTATQVTALLGNNNIWSDTGDTTVEYYADLKSYIDKKIAEIGG